ncbi:MAG TPA: hypothetical protein PKG48_07080 [Bacteroidales bacterium]|nr:hypothetical protein [Bacteroidales bacterium]HPS61748.1 hypothetical protein [Bacteroidales bacterium]
MKDPEIPHWWIDRYNAGELGDEELKIFRKKLQEDQLLQAETELDARLDRFLSDPGLLDLMDKIRRRPARLKIRRRWNRLLAAAVVFPVALTALALGLWFGYGPDATGRAIRLSSHSKTWKTTRYPSLTIGFERKGKHVRLDIPVWTDPSGRATRERAGEKTPVYRLLLADATGKPTREWKVSDDRKIIVPATGLRPGVYLWQFSANGRITLAGKVVLLPG